MILKEGDIHGDEVLVGCRIGTFIALLTKRIPNKHTRLSPRSELGLVRVMVMNVCNTPEHTEGNIKDKTGRGIRIFETFERVWRWRTREGIRLIT